MRGIDVVTQGQQQNGVTESGSIRLMPKNKKNALISADTNVVAGILCTPTHIHLFSKSAYLLMFPIST